MATTVCEAKKNTELRVFEFSDELATDLAEYVAQLSEISVKERGCFTIALSGGPIVGVMRKLCEAPYQKMLDWSKWYVLWADERAVAKTHAESNYKMTKEGLLSKVPILNSHVYSINDTLTVEEAAADYEFTIRQLVKARTISVSEINDCPKFDLILLSVGPTGSIASLHPNHPALELTDEWVTFITNSPEPPPERITFTMLVINSASNVVIVATGEDKARAVQQSVSQLSENVGPDVSVPAKMVTPTEGKLVWFVDKEASKEIELESDNFEL
ncbi:putative 6-phosphogluconolactonase 1 [Carex littledalei]|uniref:Probable 6-phosphogluconolactonase n=1 Tax=Carex littledalei TaxID=544730 RepID=A0A833VF06_9POAL|nr:putative 6-phosphogluconolactonase 1 [Carex littledalei]